MAQLFWCARNLDTFVGFAGNHHFITVKLAPGEAIPGVTAQSAGGVKFVTFAAFNVGGRLKFEANQKSDVQAVKEYLDPSAYKDNWSDFDLEFNEVKPPKGKTALGMAEQISVMGKAYRTNEAKKGNNVTYDLANENCAAWVNTVFKKLGVKKSARDDAGEFSGIDWGEEDFVPEELFTP